MKPRDPEAVRLEEDYLGRVRAALAGRPEAEIADVVQSVREHIEESVAALEGGAVSLSGMAGIIERLGPPDAYRAGELRGAEASPTAAGVAAVSANGVDYVAKPFEFGSCFGDAAELYSRNFLPLLLVSMVFYLLSVCSLLILTGPLAGGIMLMMLRAVDRADHKVEFEDMFRMLGKFWPLLGLFFLATLGVLIGLAFCIVPGVLLETIWGFSALFMVEQGTGVFESMRRSCATATAPGRFATNFLLALTVLAMCYAGGAIPYIGVVISWLVAPLTWLICTLAYVRQTRGVERRAQPAAALMAGV